MLDCNELVYSHYVGFRITIDLSDLMLLSNNGLGNTKSLIPSVDNVNITANSVFFNSAFVLIYEIFVYFFVQCGM